jgi:Sap-like sulfolipid-1-addressing protein
MHLAILPLAITMMAGPQIMSAIIFLTASRAVRLSVSFVLGVAIATVVGLVFALALLSVLGEGVSLGGPSNDGSIGKLIQYALVALLIALALKNYVRRESVEPPRWLGALQDANQWMALKTGLLVIWLMPGDIIVLLTVAANLEQNGAGLLAALPFIAATLLIAALPLLLYLLFYRGAQQFMPRVREWMNTHSWLLNVITCVIFIALII